MNFFYHHYWGKASKTDPTSFHLLPYHCMDVAAVARGICDQDSSLRKKLSELLQFEDQSLQSLLIFSIALHDIGKFSHTFQNIQIDISRQFREVKNVYYVRHDSLGYIFLKDHFGE